MKGGVFLSIYSLECNIYDISYDDLEDNDKIIVEGSGSMRDLDQEALSDAFPQGLLDVVDDIDAFENISFDLN